MTKNKKNKKVRPPRLFLTKTGRPYVLVKKKRVYIKPEKNMSQRQLVNVVINNFRKGKTRKNKQSGIKPATLLDGSSSSGITKQAEYLNFLNHTFLNKKEDAEKIIGRIEEKTRKQNEGKAELLGALTNLQESSTPAIQYQSELNQTNQIRDLLHKEYKQGYESEQRRINENKHNITPSFNQPLPPLPEKKSAKQKLDFTLQTPKGNIIRTDSKGRKEVIEGQDELNLLSKKVSKLDTDKKTLENKRKEESELQEKKHQRRELEHKVEKLTYIKLDMLKSLGFTGTRPQIISKLSDEQLNVIKNIKKSRAESLEKSKKLKSYIVNKISKNMVNEELKEEKKNKVTQRQEVISEPEPFPSGPLTPGPTAPTPFPTPTPASPYTQSKVISDQIMDEHEEKQKEILNFLRKDKQERKLNQDIPERSFTEAELLGMISDSDEEGPPNVNFYTPKEKTDKENTEGSGKHHVAGGLWSDQLEKIMHRYKNFAGVYPSDQLNKMPVKDKMGFIMNTSSSDKPGKHWVACYIDTKNDRAIEYYDSFGREPSKEFMKNIKGVINKLSPDTYLKFKVNKIKQQSANSNNCGIFCAKFLTDRFESIPFKDCTGYSEVKKGEEIANKLRKKWTEFGYI
jgi:Ulp1 protease family, C-terminal catalytic domain